MMMSERWIPASLASSGGIGVIEDDAGTKEKVKRALQRTQRELSRGFIKAVEEYWYKVWQTACQLCLEYGAYDTGTLYSSIRLVWNEPITGGTYEVVVSSEGAEVTAMIKVGGMEFINPKTGKYVDYAAAVHDGTRYMMARPFLTDAVAICEPFLYEIQSKHIDMALQGFERVM